MLAMFPSTACDSADEREMCEVECVKEEKVYDDGELGGENVQPSSDAQSSCDFQGKRQRVRGLLVVYATLTKSQSQPMSTRFALGVGRWK